MGFKWKMIWLVGPVVLGCATAPKPVEPLAQSEAAMRGAEELGAQQVPQAALELRLAQEELEKARVLMKDNDNDKASLMLSRPRADAELALSLTRETRAQADARTAQDQLGAVQQAVAQ